MACFAGVLIAYSLVLLFAANPPPFVDYPDWVYQGVLFRGVLTGHPVVGYALKHYPVPNSLTTVGLGLLCTVLPWAWAAKAWVVAYLALSGATYWVAAGAMRLRDGWMLAAVPGIVVVNLNFWYGHISFEIGLCLVVVLLVMLMRGAGSVAVATLLLLLFFTHMEACAVGLLLLALWGAAHRQWRRLWCAAPTVAMTAWYAAARYGAGDRDAASLAPAIYRYGSGRFLLYKANTFVKVFGFVNATNGAGRSQTEWLLGRPGYLLLVTACLALATLFLGSVVALRATATGPEDGARRPLRWLVLALLVVSAVLPQSWLGVADPGSRLILAAAVFAFFLLPWGGRIGAMMAVLSLSLCLVNLWQLDRVERNPALPGRVPDLPPALLTFGHVEPATRLRYYTALRDGRMDEDIFPTALFLRQVPR